MFEMTRMNDTWQGMPLVEEHYTCDVCGRKFYPDEYGVRAYTAPGLQQDLCEDCWNDHLEDYALHHAKKFIRSCEEVTREFAEEWFNNLPTEDKVRWIMELYEAHEARKLSIETDFCDTHPQFIEMVEQDEGVEHL